MIRERHDCEILVVGAGPAGIAAASVAAEAGRKVIVLDNSPQIGGQIWRGEGQEAMQRAARRWIFRVKNSGVRVFSGATLVGTSGKDSVLAETRTHVMEIGWQKLVLAVGAREVFLPFPGWTLPGVVGAGGLDGMAKHGWPLEGKRVVVAGSGPLLLAVADAVQQHGGEVVVVAEQAPWSRVLEFGLGLLRHPGKLAQGVAIRMRLAGVSYRCGCWPVKAEGSGQVQSVTLTDGRRIWTEGCDYLACGFHLAPNLEVPLLLGCEVANEAVWVNELQETSVKNVFCAGEPTGIGGCDCALVEGEIAGWAAAGKAEEAGSLFGRRASWRQFRLAMKKAFALRPELRQLATDKTIFCRCEDIPLSQMAGFSDWRAAKLQTRCGMGACQGRICGTAARFLFGWNITSARPPVFPVHLASLVTSDTLEKHNSATSGKCRW